MLTIEQHRGILAVMRDHVRTSIDVIAPHDYPSLKKHVETLELQDALSQLNEMIETPKSFITNFKVLCRDRARQNKNTLLDFSVTPDSAANTLFWQIARILAPSEKLKDIIPILLPDITSIMHLEMPDSFSPNLTKAELKEAMRTMAPIPVIRPLMESDVDISPNGLVELVISDQIIFDTRELLHYNYHRQAGLHTALHREYPNLAKKLYEHNDDLRVLNQNIQLLSRDGKTPRVAIENLIKGLLLGGERKTGETYAGTSAYLACGEFLSYWNRLPESLCSKLESMSSSFDKTLRDTLSDLNAGNCVETAASNLKYILEKNQNIIEFNTPPSLTTAQIDEIINTHNQQAKKGLSARKINNEGAALPISLLKKSLGSLSLNSMDKWIDILLGFQPEMYGDLFECLDVRTLFDDYDDLFSMVNEGIFNQEQCAGLGAALTRSQYVREGIDRYIPKILRSKSSDMLNQFMTAKSLKQLPIKSIQSVLGQVKANPALIASLLDEIHNDEAKIAFVKPMLFSDDLSLDTLTMLFSKLTDGQRKKVLDARNCGMTILHSVRHKPKLLDYVLKLYPIEARLLALKETDYTTNASTLSYNVNNRTILHAILSLLPESDRIEALKVKNSQGKMVLDDAESLGVGFEFIPPTRRLSVFKEIVTYGSGDNAWKKPENVIRILTVLPEEERLNALIEKNKYGQSLLAKIRRSLSIGSLTAILSLLPKHQNFDLLKEINSKNPEVTFVFKLEIMRQKTHQLCEKRKSNANYIAAADAAEKLVTSIDQYRDELMVNNDYKKFKRNCMQAINQSKGVLVTHRGWKQIIGNLVLAILGLGVLYACAVAYNKNTTGNYLFFKTDSAEKLDDLSNGLNLL